MEIESWEYGAPAHLQYWPAHVNPTGPEAWDQPQAFPTLREAITAAITNPAPPAQVAYILTSSGRMLRQEDIEAAWLDLQSA